MRVKIEACVFDAYGTLLDLTSAIEPHLDTLGDMAPRLLTMWRAKQLEYTWLRTLMERYADFARVTADALDYTCAALGIANRTLRESLLAGFQQLNAFPDAEHTLRQLRSAGLRTAVLSNGTPAMLKAAFSRSGLTPLLDTVISVEPVASYKPAVRVYGLASEALGLKPEVMLFVSANAWDACGAASAGLSAVWINRAGAPAERLPIGPAQVVNSLSAIPGLIG